MFGSKVALRLSLEGLLCLLPRQRQHPASLPARPRGCPGQRRWLWMAAPGREGGQAPCGSGWELGRRRRAAADAACQTEQMPH